ncbi:MAG TPA: hypothetical protein H9903_00020 [Candidatus Aquabacterium excrementipullorum]|nr:hypothetical protein [Candidatus Aquabacterium excrementipullorum]
MNRSVWLRTGATVALPLAMVLSGVSVRAEAVDEDASFSLKLSHALRERTFMRAGVIYANVKTTSGEAYDVTGPVIKKGDLQAASSYAEFPIIGDHMSLSGDRLDEALDKVGWTGLGAPSGVRARSQSDIGTLALSVGYYLTDDFTWMLETYVLAAPLKSKIYGDGINATGKANYINGKHILDTKLLPPTVLLGRYWGDKDAKFRPYTGVMAMYAIFFDTKATQTLNAYMGGASPGDTSVSVKNAFGLGPSLGFKYQLGDDWHVSLNVGSVKLKTQATLTTRNTTITTDSAVINDYPQPVLDAIAATKNLYDNSTVFGDYYRSQGGSVTVFMKGVAASRGSDNLGTYVRKQDTTLTSTLMMLSVGRSF